MKALFNFKSVTIKIALLVLIPMLSITALTILTFNFMLNTVNTSSTSRSAIDKSNTLVRKIIGHLKDDMLNNSAASADFQKLLQNALMAEDSKAFTKVIKARNNVKVLLIRFLDNLESLQDALLEAKVISPKIMQVEDISADQLNALTKEQRYLRQYHKIVANNGKSLISLNRLSD